MTGNYSDVVYLSLANGWHTKEFNFTFHGCAFFNPLILVPGCDVPVRAKRPKWKNPFQCWCRYTPRLLLEVPVEDLDTSVIDAFSAVYVWRHAYTVEMKKSFVALE